MRQDKPKASDLGNQVPFEIETQEPSLADFVNYLAVRFTLLTLWGAAGGVARFPKGFR